jgi:uncharacterized protein (TIGR02145 family)
MFRKLLSIVLLLSLISLIGCTDKAVAPLNNNESNSTSVPASMIQAFPGQIGEVDSGYFRGEKIYYNRINNLNVFQGDIILADSVISKTPVLQKREGAIRTTHLWPNNIVYFTINADLPNPARVTAAINHWTSNTNLVFINRTNQTNFIRFQLDPDGGCWSNSIGMLGGQQIISLADWGTTGDVIHEIGHAVNFFHEQSRTDRNSSIIIVWDNIDVNWWSQFSTFTASGFTDGSNNGTYDFNSIMHYPCFSYTVADGGCAIDQDEPIITKLDNTTWTTNNTNLSAGDIAASKTLYPLGDADGNVYTTVKIGTQIWAVENLRTTKYNDGTPIPYVTDNEVWGGLSTPGYCWYSNDIANKPTYGALYNWYVVDPANPQKIAPTGWHVATDADWNTLTSFLGGSTSSGGKMKEAGLAHWLSPNTGATNESGFTALPGGIRGTDRGVYFNLINKNGLYWSSTNATSSTAYSYTLIFDRTNVVRSLKIMNSGLSVRLVKD